MADLVAAGAFTMDAMAGIATRYGLEFGTPAWLPDVVSRYGLTVA